VVTKIESDGVTTARKLPRSAPIGVFLLATMALLAGQSHTASAALVSASPFNGPTGIATCGSDIWITNVSGDSVTELNAVDGSVIQEIGNAGGNFAQPMGIAANGANLWVTNVASNTVSELNCNHGSSIHNLYAGQLNAPVAVAASRTRVWVASQGHVNDGLGNAIANSSSVAVFSTASSSLIKSIAGSNGNRLNGTSGVSIAHGEAWVTNANGNSVSEFNATTGRLVLSIADGTDGLNWPMGVVTQHGDVWIANLYGNSVTELKASDGSLVRVITGDGLNGPASLAVQGKHIWVTNLFGDSVTELVSRNGSLVRTVKMRADGFNAPMGIVASGPTVWVANQGGNSVTELNALNGSLLRIVG
jgi:streptogramin lyase